MTPKMNLKSGFCKGHLIIDDEPAMFVVPHTCFLNEFVLITTNKEMISPFLSSFGEP